MKNFSRLAAFALALLFVLPAAAADDAAKEKLARELMALTGAADMGKQVMEGMMAQLAANPSIPQEFADKFLELAKPEQLLDLVVPLYVSAYDEKTLKAAVTFYKTPAGRALVAAMPQITQESMVLGQQWGMELAGQVQAAMQAQEQAAEEPAPAEPAKR